MFVFIFVDCHIHFLGISKSFRRVATGLSIKMKKGSEGGWGGPPLTFPGGGGDKNHFFTRFPLVSETRLWIEIMI